MRKIDVKDGELTINDLLAGVDAGEHVDLVRGDRRIARLYREPAPMSESERKEAIKRMRQRMKEGLSLGGGPLPPRDERHKR